MSSSSRVLRTLSLTLALAGLPVLAVAPAAQAVSTGLVITEVYGAGGNTDATYDADFVELRNLGTTPASLDGLAIQYRSGSGTSAATARSLSGSVPAGERYLIRMSATGSTGDPLPTPDLVASPAIAMSGSAGVVALTTTTTPLAATGDLAGDPSVVDVVGYGRAANTFETRSTGVDLTSTTSAQRLDSAADTDDNASDFSEQGPTPDAAFDPPLRTVAEIQGTGATTPEAGNQVRTQGVVTARYPRGGLTGFVVQTGGAPTTDGASDAVFVYAPALPAASFPVVGASVEVVGVASEFNGLTELTLSGGVSPLEPAQPAVTPLAAPWTDLDTDAEREVHESELVAPQGPFTVTDSYATDQYGEIGLAAQAGPLQQPTEVYDAQGTQDDALAAQNAQRLVVLDDGSSTNYRDLANADQPYAWLTPGNHVRAGAPVTFRAPVVLDYRNNAWKLQPVHRVIGAGESVATFADTSTPAPEAVGGDIRLATFNVLNFFPTTGADFEASGAGTCSYFTDRDGQPTTVDSCDPNGPRGAADAANLARQRAKIVVAINRLGASVVSLEEIENSVVLGKDRDSGVRALVDALNAAAGAGTWAFAPSPAAADLPPTADQDVIRTAFIYQPADLALVGPSRVLTGSAAFADAREPLAQAFKRVGAADSTAFSVIVNHFKSKGSGTADPDGQGNGNDQRVAQAQALSTFASQFAAERGTAAVFLSGDFNAYSQEDPIQVLTGAGYTNLGSTTAPGEPSYYFDGLAGSLDHVLANPAALALVTGVDVWGINAEEPVAYEYSRYNGNVTLLYDATSPQRASDHNPEVVGLKAPAPGTPAPTKAASTIAADVVGKARTNRKVKLEVTLTRAGGGVPTGTVTVKVKGKKKTRTATLTAGTATVKLGRFARPGKKKVTVTYSGDATTLGSTTKLTFRVRR